MTSTVNCPSCGAPAPFSEPANAVAASLQCDVCGARFSVAMTDAGPQALLHPQQSNPEEETLPGEPQTMVVNTPAETAATLATTIVVRGALERHGATPEEGQTILRSSRVTVGRHDADIVVPDKTMSSTHFELEEREGEFFLRDLKSSNGTYLNGERVDAGLLKRGDEIAAGRTTFTFKLVEALVV